MAIESNGKGLRSEINVTPLVDVMLVLLIIFMVVTPMLQRGKDVQLPRVTRPEKQPDNGQDLIVSVEFVRRTAAGFDFNIYIGSDPTPISAANLTIRLQDELRRDASKEVYLKGDRRLSYGVVRKVMEICHLAGFGRVKLATDEIKSKEG
jgi:biopolymer transport protein TolR